MYILGYFGGPEGGLQLSDWAYLAFQLSSHPYLCTCETRKQSDKNFLSLNPKYEKKQGNSVARDLPRTGSETNTTIFVIYILDIDSHCTIWGNHLPVNFM